MNRAGHLWTHLGLALTLVGLASHAAGQGSKAGESSALARSLELDNWTESRFAKFPDGEPLTIDESAEIDRLVSRLASFDRRVFRNPPPVEVTATELLQQPEEYRGRFVKLTGRVEQTWQPAAGEATYHKSDTSHQVLSSDAKSKFLIVTAKLPKAWSADATGEAVGVQGVFVKNVAAAIDSQTQGELVPLVAAAEVQWFPAKASPQPPSSGPQVNYGMSVLGTLGIDVAVLDSIEHRKPLTRSDTGAFYQILGGIESATGRQLVDWAERDLKRYRSRWQQKASNPSSKVAPLAKEVLRLADQGAFSVAPFFNMPKTQVGELAVFDGVVRRVLRIEAGDDPDAQWAGVNHYYELALFTDDSQGNPLFFCVTELPPGFPTGEGISEPVRIAGFFFKNWRYTSARPNEGGAGPSASTGTQALQSAPLFIGRSPLRLVAEPANARWGMLAGFAFLAVLAAIWITQWRQAKLDEAFAARTLQRMQQPVGPIEFDQTGQPVIQQQEQEATDSNSPEQDPVENSPPEDQPPGTAPV